MQNLAHEYARSGGGTVDQARFENDGCCIDFAGAFCDSKKGKRLKAQMPYFDDLDNWNWKYHCAIEVNGIIHDLWMDEPMKLEHFMQRIGANSVEYPAECEDTI